jgi:2,3-dihydroxy-p-cumate/2,3-dihydroxybenzoate 3,4-dioxygenase
MIAIEQLRYVRLGTRDLAASVNFARQVLGLELVRQTDRMAHLRSDHRDPSLTYTTDAHGHALALELRDIESLDAAEKVLTEAGYAVERGTAEQCSERKVTAFIAIDDQRGPQIELVVRPLTSGWRYFPSRDAGVTGLAAVALRSSRPEADLRLWTKLLDGTISDRVGDAAYIGFDEVHHRVAVHPAEQSGLLAVEFAVESVDQLMQNWYFLGNSQVKIAHGPGRRPTSGQLFVTFYGPDDVLYSFVAEGSRIADRRAHRSRQFAKSPLSFCCWGSESQVVEFG